MNILRKIITLNKSRYLLGIHMDTDPSRNAVCNEFETDKWQISKFVVKRLVPRMGITPYPLDELMLMTAAVCYFKPQYIFEWGTHLGKSARIFYEITHNYRISTIIHSVDLPEEIEHSEHPHSDRGMYVKNIRQVKLHQGDGIATSLGLYRQLSPKGTVLFFLDGDHSYDSVSKELTMITEHVENVAILVHDTFNQSSESLYNTGPHRAVSNLLTAFPGKFKHISTSLGLPGMTLLFK
jgi:cephalosporin hydroxylase